MASPLLSKADHATTDGDGVTFRPVHTTQTTQTPITTDLNNDCKGDLSLARPIFPVAFLLLSFLSGMSGLSVIILVLCFLLFGWAGVLALLITLAFLVLVSLLIPQPYANIMIMN